jgi:hypothetical protein
MPRPLVLFAALLALLVVPARAAGCSGSLPSEDIARAPQIVLGEVVATWGDSSTRPVLVLDVEQVLKGSAAEGPRPLIGVRGGVCGDFVTAPVGTRMVIALGIPYPDFRPPDAPVINPYWAQLPTGEMYWTADLPGGEQPTSLEDVVRALQPFLPIRPDPAPTAVVSEPSAALRQISEGLRSVDPIALLAVVILALGTLATAIALKRRRPAAR